MGKTELLFPLRSFRGAGNQIDLTSFEHVEHFLPAFVVTDILEIPAGIFAEVLQIFIAVARQSAVLPLFMVSFELKKADPDNAYAGFLSDHRASQSGAEQRGDCLSDRKLHNHTPL